MRMFAWISLCVKNLRETWITATPATTTPWTIFRRDRDRLPIEKAGSAPKTSAEDGIKIGDGGIAAPPSPSGARETCGDAGGQLERNPAFTYKFGRGAGV